MKVLYIMSSYNIYGGTPKKTLDLVSHFGGDASIYFYSDDCREFKALYEETGCKVFEGNFGWNLFRHLSALKNIVDSEEIKIVQVQFSMGELLGLLLKIARPKVKLIAAFVGVDEAGVLKKTVSRLTYRLTDLFVFVSHYVKREKKRQFPHASFANSQVIYNGTDVRQDTGEYVPVADRGKNLLTIGGLTAVKNLGLLVEAMSILVHEYDCSDVHLYIVGDGPDKPALEESIAKNDLQENVFLIGYHGNVGGFLSECDIYLHPCYVEGFGIAVAEAMASGTPVIVANAGALPELVGNGEYGMVVDAHNPREWADAVKEIFDDKELARILGGAGETRAREMFSLNQFVSAYEASYVELLSP